MDREALASLILDLLQDGSYSSENDLRRAILKTIDRHWPKPLPPSKEASRRGGLKGGKASGSRKIRGNSDYYRRIAALRHSKPIA